MQIISTASVSLKEFDSLQKCFLHLFWLPTSIISFLTTLPSSMIFPHPLTSHVPQSAPSKKGKRWDFLFCFRQTDPLIFPHLKLIIFSFHTTFFCHKNLPRYSLYIHGFLILSPSFYHELHVTLATSTTWTDSFPTGCNGTATCPAVHSILLYFIFQVSESDQVTEFAWGVTSLCKHNLRPQQRQHKVHCWLQGTLLCFWQSVQVLTGQATPTTIHDHVTVPLPLNFLFQPSLPVMT